MARDEYLAHLATVPLFAKCSKKQLQEIGRVADEINLTAGTVLTRQGQSGVEMFIVVSGEVMVSRDGVEVATLGAGSVVGELALLTNAPRNATVTAASDVDVLVLTGSGFSRLLDDVPGLARDVLYEVAARLTEKH